MTDTTIFGINENKAISETLDGETIIINLETGNYYSLNETGSVLWNSIREKRSTKQLIEYFINCYEGEEKEIAQAVSNTVSFLHTEGLILQMPQAAQGQVEKAVEPDKLPFVAPAIKRYEDMQEMLLADPVHDVDQLGWPSIKKTP